MTDEQLGQIYHTARNAETFRDFKRVALDILCASIADTAGAKQWFEYRAADGSTYWLNTPHVTPAPSVADAAADSGINGRE